MSRSTGGAIEFASLPDPELARAIAAGDQGAFHLLMRRFNRLLYRTARSIVRDEFDAEDVVQNAYLLAYREIDKYRGDAKLSTWLVRIVINEALGCLRKRARSAHILNLADDDLHDAIESAHEMMSIRPERPDESMMRADLRRLIEKKIDELPLPRRTVFILRALEELSVSETATALGIPEATVRTRFFRARTELSASLTPDATECLGQAFSFAGERCDRIVSAVLASIDEDGRVEGSSPAPRAAAAITARQQAAGLRASVDTDGREGAAPSA